MKIERSEVVERILWAVIAWSHGGVCDYAPNPEQQEADLKKIREVFRSHHAKTTFEKAEEEALRQFITAFLEKERDEWIEEAFRSGFTQGRFTGARGRPGSAVEVAWETFRAYMDDERQSLERK